MRVELVYMPGCPSYRKTLELLEHVIAEERLPIPVELSESHVSGEPMVRVDGEAVASNAIEDLRQALSARWHSLTAILSY